MFAEKLNADTMVPLIVVGAIWLIVGSWFVLSPPSESRPSRFIDDHATHTKIVRALGALFAGLGLILVAAGLVILIGRNL